MKIKTLIGVIATLTAIYLGFFTEHPGLTSQSLMVLGLLIWAVTFWILNIFDDYIVALFMSVGWVILAGIPFNIAFAVFSTPTWWMVLSALGLGLAVAKSGLLQRLGLKVLIALPSNYIGQTLGIFLSGILLCPTIPSVIGKVSISSRFIKEIAKIMNLNNGSSHSAGLFFSMYLGFILVAPLYLTGSATNFIILEMIPENIASQMNWVTWFLFSFPTSLILMILGFILIHILFKPNTELNLSKKALNEKLSELGPMSTDEKLTTGILIMTLLLWITEIFHGISASLITILGMGLLLSFKVINRQDFQSKMTWGFLIFFGITMNTGRIFQYVELDIWIGENIAHILKPFTESLYLFFIILIISVYVLRFAFVSYNALMIITLLVIMPITHQVNINPWLVGIIIHYASQAVWLIRYQNQVYNVAYYSSEEMITSKQAFVTSFAFMIITIFGILLSVPYWSFLGLL